jgi:hypothetical protein
MKTSHQKKIQSLQKPAFWFQGLSRHESPITPDASGHKSRILPGEEKANRDNATFKNRCNHRKTKEKTFSNRDKTASSGLPVLRPASPE